MINNEKFIDTLFVTGGLSSDIVKILQERNLSDSEFALRNMIKNYKLCFKEEEDWSLSVIIDLCLMDRHGKDFNPSVGIRGGYYTYKTFGTPCYDWGMTCRFSQVEELKKHERDIFGCSIQLKQYVSTYMDNLLKYRKVMQNIKELKEFDNINDLRDIREIDYSYKMAVDTVSGFLSEPIIIDKRNRIKINDNYCLVENHGGMLLVNTECGYDQWVSVGFPISNVYVSLYDMVLECFGGGDSLVIKREYYTKIYENLSRCLKYDRSIIQSTYTGYFSNGVRYIKMMLSADKGYV